MISSWLFPNNAPRAVAVFDIGSSSIGTALVLVGNGLPEILYGNRTPIPFQKDLEIERFTKATLTALMDAALDLQSVGLLRMQGRGVRHVSDTCVIFASPWSESRSTNIELQKEKPFSITKELVDTTVQAEADKFNEADTGGAPKPILIERHAVGITLNGYRFDNPYGKKTKSVSIRSFLSFIPSDLEAKAREIITGAIPGARMIAHSFGMVLFSGTRDIHQDIEAALLIDIRGEMTDISLMRNGILETTVSFPIGERTLMRMLFESGSTRMPEEEHSRLRMYLEGRAGEQLTGSLAAELASASGVFEMSLKKTLEPLVASGMLPSQAVIVTEGDVGPWFQELIANLDMSALILGGGSLQVYPLTSDSLKNTTVAGGNVKPDPFLMLDAVFVDKILKISTA